MKSSAQMSNAIFFIFVFGLVHVLNAMEPAKLAHQFRKETVEEREARWVALQATHREFPMDGWQTSKSKDDNFYQQLDSQQASFEPAELEALRKPKATRKVTDSSRVEPPNKRKEQLPEQTSEEVNTGKTGKSSS